MLIRRETESDVEAIDGVHRSAFAALTTQGDPVEGDLVRALRSDPGWVAELSLVAELPDEGTGAQKIVGHVVCTVGSVGDVAALGLGPLGVLPEFQGSGVGSALMHAVLAASDALGYPVVVLLGHVDYYPRFGFVPARELGISPTDPAWESGFQARLLSAWSPSISGEFVYAAPFYSL